MAQKTTIESCFDATGLEDEYLTILSDVKEQVNGVYTNLMNNYAWFNESSLVNEDETPLMIAADYITENLQQDVKDIESCYNVIRYKAWRKRSKDLQSVIDYCTEEENSISSKLRTVQSQKQSYMNSATQEEKNHSAYYTNTITQYSNTINRLNDELEPIQELKKEAIRQKEIADSTATTF